MPGFRTSSTDRTAAGSVAPLNDSMRRFTLLQRKSSSYASSSGDGSKSASSGTQESVSNSSRPSLSDSSSGRRKSSKSSLVAFGSRLMKSQSRSTSDFSTSSAQSLVQKSGLTLGERFNQLPAEIQIEVLSYLSVTELLDLRTVSRHSLAIFRSNAIAIARNLLLDPAQDHEHGYSAALLIHQYPSIFSSTLTDAYLLRSLRREALGRRQLKVLITFIQTRTYMLKLTRGLESAHFGAYRNKLTARLYQPVLLFQHLLETVRHLIIHNHVSHPTLSTGTITQCPSCATQIISTIASYPMPHLLPLYHVIQLLMQHFYHATRSPSNVTIIERKLKGWAYGPPPEAHMAQVVFLGGVQELSKIDEMHGSYGKRLSVVKNFSDMVAEAVRINTLAFPDFFQTQTDPVMAMAMGGSGSKSKRTSKGKSNELTYSAPILSKQVRRDKEEVRTAIEARADEAKILKSLDVRLDLLTDSVLASVPSFENIFLGPNSLLGKQILSLRLVERDKDLANPYEFLTALMAECYEPQPETPI